ncbi:MAG: ectoine hydroxylase-related dioxygenase (phytanoyl-CoA dioxygenase family) [Acidimicrobiales bacterium]|jgi:ectoine hydroxylase-related dioxygenase (phytanoyl-CoA dioxygenase family)
MVLTPDEIEQFRTDGVVVPRCRLNVDDVADLAASLDAHVAASTRGDVDFVPNVLDHEPSWIRFAILEEVLGSVRDLIGDDVILWGSGLFCKAATNGRATPWHQDGQYWPIRPLATVTAWIAIDPVDEDNGCLRVIPGSHHDRVLHEHARNDSSALILNQELSAEQRGPTPPRSLILEPGQFSLHDVYMIHGANPNTSGRRRGALAFRFMPATSHYDRELAKRQAEKMGLHSMVNRTLFMASGADASGKNDITKLPAASK